MAFSRQWADAGNERAQAIEFWIDFFAVFGITNRRVVSFEHAVKKHGGGQGFIDLFWPGQMLVEHKSRGRPLEPAYDQAMDYFPGIAERDLPHTLVVCDFARFRVIDLEARRTWDFALADLHRHVRLFGFIAGYKAQEIRPQDPVNIRAAERMGRLHDALRKSGYTGHALEVLLVRLLFCLFADDTAIFPAQGLRAFIDERTATDGSDLGARLAQLFQVLNTPEDQRSRNLDDQLAAFPYVNGRLFEETLPIADFDAASREALLDASALDWSAISPAIFGSLFQSIMDAKARRNLGAHYTSEENILKLIQPLFLDELRSEFARVRSNRNRLFDFHKKLRHLSFLDPACGCGNFLVISYRELRLLELEVLRAAAELQGHAGQRSVDVHSLIGVNVDQFFGIEIEEFPAQIAQVALWLVDHQMNLRVSEEFGQYFARIPLVTSPHIVHGNALTIDWNEVLPATRCSYVLGNPPFVGHQWRTQEQMADMARIWGTEGRFGRLDYVTCWHRRTVEYLRGNTATNAALVSTNSICQGEQVATLWGWMLANGTHIHFAHRTFAWTNEARGKAAVHCVIIGFGLEDRPGKVIYEYENVKGDPHAIQASHINPYLVDAPDVLLPSRTETPPGLPQLRKGSQPTDGGHLIFTEAEKTEFLTREPNAQAWIRPYIGGEELINGNGRWCLWLKGAAPAQLRAMPLVMERVQRVAETRRKSPTKSVVEFAAYPTLFTQDRQPDAQYLAIPEVSSETRQYIPIGFLWPHVIASNQLQIAVGASALHFGVVSSSMYNAWLRLVGGRMKSDIRHSPAIYNNFPWPFSLPEAAADLAAAVQSAQAAIESAAQAVLDARAQFPGSSLADLYDPLTMPPALLKAHQKLDAAVDKAYQLAGGPRSYKNDAERVAFLFTLYQRITSLLPAAAAKPGSRRRRAARDSA
ncbi:DNA methyltransferase [Ottowia sp.]|nr:DNA methyltransferase [Ottowia sp.]